ncbi:putative bifunctional diguanylate cyclase/phosphodiesterase [Massilia sp. SM-13]|uniref:putative bifunctional diguanylate cyclase/phosphodiesterase n=1 Tax=Pseudoduganella rhizocola TaxID=3382643 RepID=UPI0038B55A95
MNIADEPVSTFGSDPKVDKGIRPCPWLLAGGECAILDTLPDQIAVLNQSGSIVEANAAWKQFARRYGHNASDAVARSEAGARAVQGVNAVLGGAVPSFGAEYACTLSGSQRWFAMTVTALAGGRHGAVICHHDITQRKRNEERLNIAAIAFESPQGMMVTDAHGRIVQVNSAFSGITGYAETDVLGHTPAVLSSGKHDEAFYRAMWDAIGANGMWAGEIWNRRKNGEIYPEWLSIAAVVGDGGAVTHYVATFTDITVSKAASDEIRSLAFYDPLTRLPNRRLFLDRLKHAISAIHRHRMHGALLFLDLDNFKTLNDTLGHSTGDLLLQHVAQRLVSCVRDSDTVARLGGDEFVLIIEDLGPTAVEAAAQTKSICNKILAELNAPYRLASHTCHSTPTIGATLFNDSRQKPDELLMQADIAMYQAKRSGRNTMCFFDHEMQLKIAAKAQLESDLRRAIENEEFELYYQMQVDRIIGPVGAEALIRWNKPGHGFVPPSQFIPLAEEMGLIARIGNWALDAACKQLAAWQLKPEMRGLVVAVNVSARQFRESGFRGSVLAALERHGVRPHHLKLELTEGVLIENTPETIASMKALRDAGLSFALDDFGTGYSSLQYLKKLPLEQLKIDQSFVRELVDNEGDQAIVRTIIAMAHSLSLDVIAEGVETEAQREMLETFGCNRYQGYLFSKPLPAAEFEELLV